MITYSTPGRVLSLPQTLCSAKFILGHEPLAGMMNGS